VAGDGPVTIVVVSPLISQLELAWEEPAAEHFLGQVRCVCPGGAVGSAGAGWSDRSAAGERLDLAALALDVRAVPAACDTVAAVLSGVRSGCPVAVQFAASYPARTQSPGPGGRVREDDPAGRVRAWSSPSRQTV
jgi:hypothetical protein